MGKNRHGKVMGKNRHGKVVRENRHGKVMGKNCGSFLAEPGTCDLSWLVSLSRLHKQTHCPVGQGAPNDWALIKSLPSHEAQPIMKAPSHALPISIVHLLPGTVGERSFFVVFCLLLHFPAHLLHSPSTPSIS